jgi:hypothetical protein
MKTTLLIITFLILANLAVLKTASATKLSEAEKEGLQLMREEEKLAHDVYLFLNNKWELPIFNNILQAETRHFNAVGFLIENFELKDLSNKEVGNFQNKDLQHLYDSLTQKGSESLIAALQVGAFIEEVDIQDLNTLINSTSNETIRNTYQNLLRASGNHLRAFTGQLESRNNVYSPTVLKEKEYFAILETPHQKRGGNGTCVMQDNGCRNAQNNGKGNMRRWRGGRNQ